MITLNLVVTIEVSIRPWGVGKTCLSMINILQGSPPTPYIWDDRCNPEDVAVNSKNLRHG